MNAGLPPAQLPASEEVQVGPLAEAFKSYTSSYKFLLLRTILQEFKRAPNQQEFAIDGGTLCRAMLAHSWFPSRHYRLDLGQEDRTADIFKLLDREGFLNDGATRLTALKMRGILDLHAARLERMPRVRRLAQYPLFVLIRRWFPELNGIKEARNQVAEHSVRLFDERRPLYRLELPAERIVLHPQWCDYLHQNLTIVEGWLDSKWLRFLESRNPNVPTLSSKLWDRPGPRPAMFRQREFWNAFFGSEQLDCIYSGESVDTPYALDHFLPWSWVGHNQLWNLIPVAKSLNSDKGDRLPPAKLIGKLADAHHQALTIAREIKPVGWKKTLDEYRLGLRANDEVLQDKEKLRNAYAGTIGPMLKLAQRQGFSDWKRKA